eukprot:gene14562-20603_t
MEGTRDSALKPSSFSPASCSQMPAVHLLAAIALRHFKKDNILHADIKPDNILMNHRHDKAKICDFGSAMGIVDNKATPSYLAGAPLLSRATGRLGNEETRKPGLGSQMQRCSSDSRAQVSSAPATRESRSHMQIDALGEEGSCTIILVLSRGRRALPRTQAESLDNRTQFSQFSECATTLPCSITPPLLSTRLQSNLLSTRLQSNLMMVERRCNGTRQSEEATVTAAAIQHEEQKKKEAYEVLKVAWLMNENAPLSKETLIEVEKQKQAAPLVSQDPNAPYTACAASKHPRFVQLCIPQGEQEVHASDAAMKAAFLTDINATLSNASVRNAYVNQAWVTAQRATAPARQPPPGFGLCIKQGGQKEQNSDAVLDANWNEVHALWCSVKSVINVCPPERVQPAVMRLKADDTRLNFFDQGIWGPVLQATFLDSQAPFAAGATFAPKTAVAAGVWPAAVMCGGDNDARLNFFDQGIWGPGAQATFPKTKNLRYLQLCSRGKMQQSEKEEQAAIAAKNAPWIKNLLAPVRNQTPREARIPEPPATPLEGQATSAGVMTFASKPAAAAGVQAPVMEREDEHPEEIIVWGKLATQVCYPVRSHGAQAAVLEQEDDHPEEVIAWGKLESQVCYPECSHGAQAAVLEQEDDDRKNVRFLELLASLERMLQLKFRAANSANWASFVAERRGALGAMGARCKHLILLLVWIGTIAISSKLAHGSPHRSLKHRGSHGHRGWRRRLKQVSLLKVLAPMQRKTMMRQLDEMEIANNSTCGPECTKNGVCNEELARCEG